MIVRPFFHEPTSTLTYVVHDQSSPEAAVIDPVRDFDPASGRTAWTSAEAVAGYLAAKRLAPVWVVDTHAHADHMTGLPFFKDRYGARTVTGERVSEVQRIFREVYDLGAAFPVTGQQFDVLLGEGDELPVGPLRLRAMHTPGHTPAHMSWRLGDAVFVGDTLFMPDYGTARCDFPGGSAAQLYESVQRLYALPDSTPLYMCHDYRPGGRPMRFVTTVGEERDANAHLNARTSLQEFVDLRTTRDATLAQPALLLPSLQVNIRAGALPEPAANGVAYLKIPLNRF